jgi:hypothetical protein
MNGHRPEPGTPDWPEAMPVPVDTTDFPIAGKAKRHGQWIEVVRVPSPDYLPLVLLILAADHPWFVEDERTGDILADTRPAPVSQEA